MSTPSVTRNQHFVSRSEQRLNASGDGDYIYEFMIQRRGVAEDIRLAAAKRRKIGGNLKFDDLFSFNVAPEANLRENFEELFQQYEDKMASLTTSLLAKAAVRSSDVVVELVDLMSAKLMNFVRNPFSIERMLNTFPNLRGLRPTDPDKNALLERVLNGRNPHQKYICGELKISDGQYRDWLATIFVLLEDLRPGHTNMLNQIVADLFNSRDTAACAMVCTYSEQKVLLSDRATSSNIANGPKGNGFDFNLSKSAFVRYLFLDKAALVEGKAHPDFIAQALEIDRQQTPRLMIRYERDVLPILQNYNWHVVNQSHQRVFCASKKPLLTDAQIQALVSR